MEKFACSDRTRIWPECTIQQSVRPYRDLIRYVFSILPFLRHFFIYFPTFTTIFQGEMQKCIQALVDVDRDWVPDSQKASLYIRPTMIGTEPTLGVSVRAVPLTFKSFFEKSKFSPKIEIFPKNRNVRQKRNFLQKSKIFPKKLKFSLKIDIFPKN